MDIDLELPYVHARAFASATITHIDLHYALGGAHQDLMVAYMSALKCCEQLSMVCQSSEMDMADIARTAYQGVRYAIDKRTRSALDLAYCAYQLTSSAIDDADVEHDTDQRMKRLRQAQIHAEEGRQCLVIHFSQHGVDINTKARDAMRDVKNLFAAKRGGLEVLDDISLKH